MHDGAGRVTPKRMVLVGEGVVTWMAVVGEIRMAGGNLTEIWEIVGLVAAWSYSFTFRFSSDRTGGWKSSVKSSFRSST